MENQPIYVTNYSKKYIGFATIIFSIILIFTQIALILYTAYLLDKDPGYFSEFGGLPIAYGTILTFVTSIIVGILSLINRKGHIVPIILILVSLTLFTMRRHFVELATHLWTTNVQDQKIAEEREKLFYKNFYNEINGVHKVIHVDVNPINSENVLILENGNMITFWTSSVPSYSNSYSKQQANFTNWAKSNLEGQDVVIVLPKTFYKPYDNIKLCSNLDKVPYYITDPVFKLREKYNISKYQGKYCNIFILSRDQGDILLKGKSVDELYR